jgi:hypothetical protein
MVSEHLVALDFRVKVFLGNQYKVTTTRRKLNENAYPENLKMEKVS